jgi:hypothetical protein
MQTKNQASGREANQSYIDASPIMDYESARKRGVSKDERTIPDRPYYKYL